MEFCSQAHEPRYAHSLNDHPSSYDEQPGKPFPNSFSGRATGSHRPLTEYQGGPFLIIYIYGI